MRSEADGDIITIMSTCAMEQTRFQESIKRKQLQKSRIASWSSRYINCLAVKNSSLMVQRITNNHHKEKILRAS